jgi:hypothetical protein
MRVGDFGVDVVPIHEGDVREVESGHVLARPGTVYGLRLRNYGPLRCVADVRIDGKLVTAGGLVLDAYGAVTLERPIDPRETGRFTVIAEGDERVFGPDGGRDNPDLGSIEARFRRELPHARSADEPRPLREAPPILPISTQPRDVPLVPPRLPSPPGRPMMPPEWTPPGWQASAASRPVAAESSAPVATPHERDVRDDVFDRIERAAGTGLTGRSSQEFVPIAVGPLEKEATVIRLRLVIGTDEAFAAPRPLPAGEHAPVRPAPRP